MIPKAQSTKGKSDRLDFIKIKKLGFKKDSVKKIKREATNWQAVFAKHIFDNGPECVKNSQNTSKKKPQKTRQSN